MIKHSRTAAAVLGVLAAGIGLAPAVACSDTDSSAPAGGNVGGAVGNSAGAGNRAGTGASNTAGGAGGAGGAGAETANPYGPVEIRRDTYGVPHIYADKVPAAMFGFGYAQAEDHLALMADFYLEAQGKLAETFKGDDPNTRGTDSVETMEELLRSDLTARLFRVAADVEEQWAVVNDKDDPSWTFSTSDMVEAFAAGVNRFRAVNPEKVPSWVPSFTGQGILAMGHLQAILGHSAMLATTMVQRGQTPTFGFLTRPASEWAGSNQFAVGPSRMQDKESTVVLAAPHLPFYGHTVWYEAHLSAGPLNVIGATFYGLPVLPMAHNGRIAFSETSNQGGADGADVFSLDVLKSDSTRYRLGDGDAAFQTVLETVTLADGTTHTHTLVYADLGGFRCPVIAPLGTADFSSYDEILVGCTTTDRDIWVLTQLLKMDLAQSVDEFKAAMEGRHLDMWNFAVGSDTGDIYYLCNSRHPVRVKANHRSSIISGSDPANHWQGIVPFAQLPQVTNPAAGYFQNCNNSPGWLTAEWEKTIKISDYPEDICSHSEDRGLRPRRMLALLEASGKLGHTYKGLQDIAMDTYLLAAEWYVPMFRDGFARLGGSGEIRNGNMIAKALAVFDGWDYRADVHSRASTLFHAFGATVKGEVKTAPEDRPQGTLSDGELIGALNQLGSVYQELSSNGLNEIPEWGDVHRIKRGNVDVPMIGSESWSQAIHLTGTEDPDNDGIGHAWTGSSFVMLTQLGPDGVRAMSMKPWGQSDDPTSAHYSDLTRLFAESRYKPVWFDRAEVEANTESTKVLP